LDLSNTDLDKHFDLLSKTIQQEIFTGHQVTSPMLFGNRVEGQLGGRSEMRDSYEIFKNTYINDKQRALEQLFTELAGLFGLNYEMKIVPVEPIGFEFSEATIKEVAPKEWILEKLGIDPLKYGEAPVQNPVQNGVQVNESLKNLTGRQWQNISRIIRNFENQKISQEQARLLLKSSLGLTDEEINIMLSIDNNQEFSSQEQDQLLIFEFSKHGEPKDDFHVIKVKEYFNFADEPTQMETNVLDLVKKDKRITPEVIAKALKIKIEEASTIIQRLTDNGLIEAKQIKHGNDIVTERTLAKPLNEITDQKPRTLEYKIMYSYEGPKDSKNRDFCRQLLELDKFFSRADIETMSRRLGYSVWDRRGGWWTKPNGNHSPSCRHKWVQNFVIRKK
jgi:DNA-binding Lrp family transcriptional regulator